MTRRPLLLDLFCCQGGAAMGYHRAGFDVLGVDINPQPRYPFEFIQGDALEYLAKHGHEFDAIHASPPCQAYSALRHAPNAKEHPELVDPTRDLLMATGVPWVIENVVGSPLREPITLCGSMFGLGVDHYQLRRHRLFETSHAIANEAVPSCNHRSPVIGVYGDHVRDRTQRKGSDFPGRNKVQLAGDALGIDWMDWKGLSQSVPPAYTEFVGIQLMDVVASQAAA